MQEDIQKLHVLSEEISQNLEKLKTQNAVQSANAKIAAQNTVQQMYADFEKYQEEMKQNLEKELAEQAQIMQLALEQEKASLRAYFDKNAEQAVENLTKEVISGGYR